MAESDNRGVGSSQPKLPSLSSSFSRPSDGSSSLRRQPLSPPLLPSTSSGALPPPPPPTRLHSYHHPIAASYASGSSYSDRNRQPAPPSWKEHRSPPLEHRSSEGAGSSSSSRVLPPLSSSNPSSNGFQLPSLSASLPPSASWQGRDFQHQSGFNGSGARDSHYNEQRRPAQDPKLLSLAGQLRDLNRPLPTETSPNGFISPGAEEQNPASRKQAKAHVPSACLNCKRAHLACDVGRPCRRCVNLGKSDTCIDVQHKKRGRPRLKDRPSSQAGVPTLQSLEGKSDVSGSPASASYTRQSPGSEQGYFRSPTRNDELVSPPLLSSSTVMHVSGRTHGPGAHPRSASNSVSASSYPYSRPDHLRYPMDTSSNPGAGQPTSSWSYQQQPTHVSGPTHPMTGRHHSHSLSYEQQQQQQQQQHPQQASAHRQSQQQHGVYAHPASQSAAADARMADSASDTSDSIMSAVVTMICSTNLQCARISEECTALLGYKPSELNERSLFELVHPSETGRLQDIWTSLIDPVGVVPQSVPAAAEVVMSTPAARLMAPAAGTIFVQENMRLRQRNGMFDFYSVRLHLGGGFGVDLYRTETLDRAYIVASLLKLGNDAVHPDPSILRAPYSHDPTQAQGFRTPSVQQAHERSMHPASQHQRHRSDSLHRPPAHNESHAARNGASAQSKAGSNGLARQDSSRGIKRSSVEMDQDELASTSHAATSLNGSQSNGSAVANASYSAAKTAACSPPPAVRSLLSDRTRGNTNRDGILC